MSHSNITTAFNKISTYIFLLLLAYMPLHIFLSTWVGSSLGILEIAKNLKDAVMLLGFLLALIASYKQPWFKTLIRQKIVWLIIAYCLLNLIFAWVKPTDQDAEILGIVYGTRFFVFFLYGLLVAQVNDANKIIKQAVAVVLAVGAVVLLFGAVQYLWLPNNALTHVGYSRSNGVLPAFFIDDKPNLERAMSTLRDPNSFGSYLIIIGLMAFAALGIKQKKQFITLPRLRLGNVNVLAASYHILVLACLWFTFSRSAWIGFIAAAAVYVTIGKDFLKKYLNNRSILIIVALLLIALSSLYVFRNSYFIQNVVLHKDQSTVLEDPNQLRVRFWQESIQAIEKNPIGYGPGTAGLASIRNNIQGTVLNENYYFQIAHELGVVGLVLFLAICFTVAMALYRQTNNWIALALFASFVGLAITNFLVHIWANEAVAYTWWGLAGLVFLQNKFISKKLSHQL